MEKRLAPKLQPDTQLFYDAFKAAPIGIAVENLEGQLLFVNPALCSMLGFSEGELRTKRWADLSPPEDAAKDWALFQQLRAGSIDHYHVEKQYFRRDGALVWGNLRRSLLNSGASPLVLATVEDITDKKRKTEALSRYAAIVESSEDAIASGTLNGTIVSWNAGAQQMYGYSHGEAIGKPITILVPPELPDEENKILETLRAGGRIEHFETVRVTKTGKKINVSLSISPIKDSTGKTVGCCGIARDITGRKQAEWALRESEERLRLAQKVARIGSFERNIRTGVNTWTAEMESMYGLPPGSFGQTRTAFENLVHPDDRAGVIELVDCALKSGQPTEGEWRVIWPDGSLHWIAGRWQALVDESGEFYRVVGVNIDVTERKWAEEALRDSEERFRLVANSAPVMIWMTGLDRKPTYFNQFWLDFTGLSEVDLQNGLTGIVHPDDCQPGLDVYLRAFHQRQPFRKECRLRRYDGQYRWMLDIGVPRFHKDGSFAGYIGSCIDFTDRKLAEEALAEMSRKLIEAQEQERARIARELHDDINQRVAMLTVELEQLQDNPSDIQSRVQKLRKEAIEISKGVQALSHDLHSFQLEHLGVVAGMKSWCHEFGERHGLQIDCRHDVRSTVPVEVGLCLFRVLQEALHNAAKHSGVKRIEAQLHEEAGGIHLIVQDFGRGFDIQAVRQGRGLGLTSMQERVRLVNGTIEIQSKPLGGTRIHVRVPLDSGRSSQRQII
jgi:PAS domain S-box-containing protein